LPADSMSPPGAVIGVGRLETAKSIGRQDRLRPLTRVETARFA
jgi:hypothetical protein